MQLLLEDETAIEDDEVLAAYAGMSKEPITLIIRKKCKQESVEYACANPENGANEMIEGSILYSVFNSIAVPFLVIIMMFILIITA